MIIGIVAGGNSGGSGPTPPDPLNLVLQFTDGYTPPDGDAIELEFEEAV